MERSELHKWTRTPDGRTIPRRSLADRIAGGKVKPRRKEPSVPQVMRQVEASDLKRAFG